MLTCPLLKPAAVRRLLDLHETNGRYGRIPFKLFALAFFSKTGDSLFE